MRRRQTGRRTAESMRGRPTPTSRDLGRAARRRWTRAKSSWTADDQRRHLWRQQQTRRHGRNNALPDSLSGWSSSNVSGASVWTPDTEQEDRVLGNGIFDTSGFRIPSALGAAPGPISGPAHAAGRSAVHGHVTPVNTSAGGQCSRDNRPNSSAIIVNSPHTGCHVSPLATNFYQKTQPFPVVLEDIPAS